MVKTLLLQGILNCLSLNKEGVNVCYDCENGIEIRLKSKNDVKYYNSILSKNINIVADYKGSCVKLCNDSFNVFLSKYPDSVVIVKEGIDIITGEIVYVRVEAIKNNLDCLLLRLCREFDCVTNALGVSLESLGEFVYEGNPSCIDIFSLNMNIEGDEDKVLVKVVDDKVICNELYSKVPSFKTSFNEGLLRCIWSLIGNFVLEANLIKSYRVNYPFMYSLFIEGGI